MSLEEGRQPATLIRKRPYSIAFASSQAAIASVVPQVSDLFRNAATFLSTYISGVNRYVNEHVYRWQGTREQGQELRIASKKRRKKVRDGETDGERDARRALRRRTRAETHSRARVDPQSPTPRYNLREQAVFSTATLVDTNSPPAARTEPPVPHLHRVPPHRSLRHRYVRTMQSCNRFPLQTHHHTNAGVSSPMHRGLFTSNLDAKLQRSSNFAKRTPKDAVDVLNMMTPHKSRITKLGLSQTGAKQRLPFTENVLTRYLESPAQSSPQVTYRSPGAPMPSPGPNFNMFKTKNNNNQIPSQKDDDSLEDLIAQLRREHPHQYEWLKIDKEKAARNAEIAQKRASLTRPVRVAIPIDTAKRVEKALHGHGSHDQILVEKFNQEIRIKDLSTLKNTAWLNDEVINFYMNLISERAKSESGMTIHAFNTFFYSKLVKSGYKDVRRWAKKAKVDIAKCDLVLVPVHLGVHWCMSVINARQKRFEYWDSLKGGAGQAFSALREYMKNEAPDVDIGSWENWVPASGPQQRNGYDCGVFACQTAECISRSREPEFTQEDMPELRRRIAASILDAKIY